MAKFFLCVIVLILSVGCSPQGWRARWYVFQAESALNKAHLMKDKKIAFEKRKPFYTKACQAYIQALDLDNTIFTLMRIEEAADACRKASLPDEEMLLWAFEEEYVKTHPQEERYGDAGVGMVEM